MKKIIIYLATMLLAAMTFTGCYDLETYPGDKVNEGTFYKTGDHAHQGLMGIYATPKRGIRLPVLLRPFGRYRLRI